MRTVPRLDFLSASAPSGGVQEVLIDPQGGARRPGRARRARQLLDPQDPANNNWLLPQRATLRHHAEIELLAQPCQVVELTRRLLQLGASKRLHSSHGYSKRNLEPGPAASISCPVAVGKTTSVTSSTLRRSSLSAATCRPGPRTVATPWSSSHDSELQSERGYPA